MMPNTAPLSKNKSMIRLVLYAIELLFSMAVIITAAIWLDAYSGNSVNFTMFVGVTSFVVCIFLAFVTLKRMNDRLMILVQLGLLTLFWIFWLSAAAATSSSTATVNSWSTDSDIDIRCEFDPYYYWDLSGNDICKLNSRKDAVRACTAFCWLTWALFTGSLVLFLIDEGFLKSFMERSNNSTAAAPPTEVSTPPTTLPGTPPTSASNGAMV